MLNSRILKAMINIGLELDNLSFEEKIYVFNELQKMYGLYSKEIEVSKIIADFGKIFRNDFDSEFREHTIQTLMKLHNQIDNVFEIDDGSLDW